MKTLTLIQAGALVVLAVAGAYAAADERPAKCVETTSKLACDL